ncbi:hypothetical protein HRbin18_01921 [bacterium HR18]|nr:hypothetical protein HRbin18_01921 [bacterium HR18]
MFDKATLLYLYTETPLHAGSGTSLGIVDLPIQRERATGYPIVQASSLKGCLRDVASNGNPQQRQRVEVVFGPDTQRAADYAGAISVGDARVLLFPVRSLLGIFAWVTSKDVLARFRRDAQTAGISIGWRETGPTTEREALVASKDLVSNEHVVLEEFAFTAKEDPMVKAIAEWLAQNALPAGDEYTYWRQTLPRHLVILPENAFRDFTLFATEVISRIRLDDATKTVARGALWSEEHLPSDTLLYATLFASKPRVSDTEFTDATSVLQFVKDVIDGKRLQLGGDATVGRGFVKVRIGG